MLFNENKYSYLIRQPIISSELIIYGYGIFLKKISQVTDSSIPDTSSIIFELLTTFGKERLAWRKPLHINIDEQTLIKTNLQEFVPEDFVFEISMRDTKNSPELLKNITTMHEKGYRFTLTSFQCNPGTLQEWRDFFPLLTFVKVDIHQHDIGSPVFRSTLAKLKDFSCQIIAENVNEQEDFKKCKNLGFDLFQGNFFKKAQSVVRKKIPAEKVAIQNILRLYLSHPDINKITDEIEAHPDISINLLKLINSVAMYTRNAITSIRQALALIGIEKMKHWLFLMLYSNNSTTSADSASNALFITALQRARLMRQLVPSVVQDYDKETMDTAYICGMLSVTDILFNLPMESVLSEFNLAPELHAIILNHRGELGRLLKFVILTEDLYNKEVAAYITGLNLVHEDLFFDVIKSFEWIES